VEVPIGSGITGWVAAHKRPLRIKNVPRSRYIWSVQIHVPISHPLVYRNELLGVLNVESEMIDAYTENDEEMLGTLGGSLAASLPMHACWSIFVCRLSATVWSMK